MTDYSAFPRIEGLVDLACRKGIDVRPTLLRVLTDLYVQARSHTASEEAQYVALALPLIEAADEATRAIVTARLAAYARAPLAVVRRLRELTGQSPAATASPASEPKAEPEAEDLGAAFFDATSYERQMMLTNLEPGEADARPHPAAVETCRRLEVAVLEHRPDEFIRILQSTLMLPRSAAHRIAHDNGGEPLVIAARALGMQRAALERILLLLNPAIGQSVQRVYELSTLFDDLTAHAAETMIALWRGQAPARRGAHQGSLWNDEQRSARATATPARHQTHRRSDAVAAQFRNSGR